MSSGSELWFEVQDTNPLVVILHSVGRAEPKPIILRAIMEALNGGQNASIFAHLAEEFPQHSTILNLLTVVIGGRKIGRITRIIYNDRGVHSIYIDLVT